MDIPQIRKLKPKLKQFLKRFDDCFPRKDTRAHLPVYISGQLSDIPEKSVEPIAINAGVPPRTLQEFLSQHDWDQDQVRDRLQEIVRDEHAGPHSIGDPRRDQRRQEGGQDPRRAAAVVRRRRQEGELHRHGPPRPTPATASTACSTASCTCPRVLVRGPRALPRGRHPRRHGLPAQVEDRPGTVRPRRRQRPALRLDDLRRGLRQQARVPAGAVGPQPAVRGRGAAELHGLAQGAAGRHPAFHKHGRGRGRKTPRLASGSPPSRRVDAMLDAGRVSQPALGQVAGQGRAQGADGLGGQAPAVLPRGRRTACRASRCT